LTHLDAALNSGPPINGYMARNVSFRPTFAAAPAVPLHGPTN
jgi:hypothetical protein